MTNVGSISPESGTAALRSAGWFAPRTLEGFLHRAALKNEGFSEEAFRDKPIIGIANSWSEANHCNIHLRELAWHVKRGVIAAGGFPLEFPTISLGEFFLTPTSMLCRNLMAMDVEEMIRGLPIDGVVLLCGCDKTTPAMLMGAASADMPAIMLTGGPQLKGNWQGEELGSCTDCRRYWAELRAGTITQEEYDSMEAAIYRSPGHCMTMGTASTMAAILEAIGMSPPGSAALPGADARRGVMAEETGRMAVDLVRRGVRPSEIMTEDAFENALRTLLATGGSTNGVVHMAAVAGRVGIELPLSKFDELSRTTPMIVNLKPSGDYLMEDLFYAGGMPAVLNRLAPLLHMDAMTINGRTLAENTADAGCFNDDVIHTLDSPIHPEGGLAVLKGSLAPDGAVIKQTAASRELMRHRGRAVVFDSAGDLRARIDDPNLDVTADDVIVMKNTGPVGGPGMPEWGFLPLPKKLLEQGVRDMVRISDARMSGTAFGTIVLHASPEAAIGGPLALVQNGDEIDLDVPGRRLDLLVDERELERRRQTWQPPEPHFDRGYGRLYIDHVTQAQDGCDFDFLHGKTPVERHVRPSD